MKRNKLPRSVGGRRSWLCCAASELVTALAILAYLPRDL